MSFDPSVQLGPLKLPNPVLLASGTAGYGKEISRYLDLSRLGGIMVKGVAPEPWLGNPQPRTVETPGGLINSIGLENPGLKHFLEEDLPFLKEVGIPVIVNVIGHTVEEYARVARGLRDSGVAALELNISCPNIEEGGIHFGHDPRQAAEVTRAVREENGAPLFVKLSPNAPDVLKVAEAVLKAGADGLSAMNTYVAMAVDVWQEKPVLPGITGGLSGPAIKPLVMRWVWELYREFSVPIIAMGGITRFEDAAEYMLAGASAVAVGTASFINPSIAEEILEGLLRWGASRQGGQTSFQSAIGAAHKGVKRKGPLYGGA
ncbi:MAG: dihydroorotate dehydrogenase [Clostridiales bacterium]|nr:dihydroorotate dehydrogenase [Clostridiales bacterium]